MGVDGIGAAASPHKPVVTPSGGWTLGLARFSSCISGLWLVIPAPGHLFSPALPRGVLAFSGIHFAVTREARAGLSVSVLNLFASVPIPFVWSTFHVLFLRLFMSWGADLEICAKRKELEREQCCGRPLCFAFPSMPSMLRVPCMSGRERKSGKAEEKGTTGKQVIIEDKHSTPTWCVHPSLRDLGARRTSEVIHQTSLLPPEELRGEGVCGGDFEGYPIVICDLPNWKPRSSSFSLPARPKERGHPK